MRFHIVCPLGLTTIRGLMWIILWTWFIVVQSKAFRKLSDADDIFHLSFFIGKIFAVDCETQV